MGVSIHSFAGTYEPSYARIAATQTYLIKVDLPPMLGPVIKSTFAFSSSSLDPTSVSLGTKISTVDITLGCAISFNEMKP